MSLCVFASLNFHLAAFRSITNHLAGNVLVIVLGSRSYRGSRMVQCISATLSKWSNIQWQYFPTCGPWTPGKRGIIPLGLQIYLLQNDYKIFSANTILFLKLLCFWWRWVRSEFIYCVYWLHN